MNDSVASMVSVPDGPGGLPLLGHMVPLLRDPLALLRALPAHGDLVQIRLGPVPVVFVCDPDLTEQVLRHDRIFDKGGPLFELGREVLGDGIATCPYSAHRRQRRLLQPSFHPNRLPRYADVMTRHITAMADSWHDGQILDVTAETKWLTSAVTATTLFSSTVPDSKLRQAVDDVATLADSAFRRALMRPPLDRLPTRSNRAFGRARSRLHDALGTIVAARRTDPTGNDDLLSTLLEARTPDGESLTDIEVINQIITFFVAGTETTAYTLAWALYLLDRHPDVTDRFHSEVDTVLAGRSANYADLPHLQLTGRIIFETLRLYPPGWLFTRLVTEDIDLGKYRLHAGTTIAYSAYLIHHHRGLYPDPERFDPDRWDSTRTRPTRAAFIPFGGGARKCIGDTFAITLATLALATIAVRWQLHTLNGNHIRIARSALLYPRRLRMRATTRTQN